MLRALNGGYRSRSHGACKCFVAHSACTPLVGALISRGAGQIHRHPRLEMLFTLQPMHTVMTWLGSFGAPTPKPIRLWSSQACAAQLAMALAISS